jgi:RimJ/RimL family protein N-acetyltransferase
MPNPWRSERLIYRAVEETDEAFLSSVSNDAEAFMNAAPVIPLPQGKASAKEFREMIGKGLLAAIVCLPPPVNDTSTVAPGDEASTKPIPIGMVTLGAEDQKLQHHRRSEIGINLVAQYRSQGYGSEAIKWALRFGFMRCNLHRIQISGFGYNPGALKLYERLGFKVDARLREHLWHDGQYWDFVTLSMLDYEWKEQYGSKE